MEAVAWWTRGCGGEGTNTMAMVSSDNGVVEELIVVMVTVMVVVMDVPVI